jgi:hypothetical protein
LEFIRQSLDVDDIHFIPRRKRTNFKPKREVGPFIVVNRSTLQVVEAMLQGLGLKQGEAWKYDPLGVINAKRLEFEITGYEHQSRPDLEQLRNLDSWQEVQNRSLSSQDEDIDTPQQHEKVLKRNFNQEFQNISEAVEGSSSKRLRIEDFLVENLEEEVQSET